MVMTNTRREQFLRILPKDPVKMRQWLNNYTPRRTKEKRYTFQLRYRGKHLVDTPTVVDQFNNKIKVYQNYKAEYLERVRYAPKIDPREAGGAPPICFSSIGTGRSLKHRPLGRLPPHIIEPINDHYLQLTHGMMVPEADLYNNDDLPVEYLFPAVIDQREYRRMITEVGNNEEKSKQLQGKNSQKPPQPQPYSAQHMVNGEIIGKFVIYGHGQIARAICTKTQKVFTAQVLPEWKACRVMDVMRRLQIWPDITTYTADEKRLSELCVSKRTEIIKSLDRYILFTPTEATTIHSYAVERLDRITEKEVMEIYRKVVEIVRFCHSRKVLFRNFKTRNFYLTKQDNGEFVVRPCFLQDMCCEEDDSDSLSPRRQVCVPFMAPEMLTVEAKPLHTIQTDLWGLGILLYILLVGRYPFHNEKLPLLFRAIKLQQHRWPTLFITSKSRDIVNGLLKKSAKDRTNLDSVWQAIQGDYPEIRCRSNLLWKQQDLRTKCSLFKMYWDTYKDRLMPKNVVPIHEELVSCERDLPVISEMAKRDMRLIEESIKFHRFAVVTGYHETVMEARLQHINKVLAEREDKEAKEEDREPNPVQLTTDDISMELLLPECIYPISEHYHPSHKPVDWLVYMALRDAGELDFPVVWKGTEYRLYACPNFKGENIHPNM